MKLNGVGQLPWCLGRHDALSSNDNNDNTDNGDNNDNIDNGYFVPVDISRQRCNCHMHSPTIGPAYGLQLMA
jgi:hypothetical protein